MMALLLLILSVIGLGLKGLFRAMNQADEEGVIKKTAEDGVIRLIDRFLN